MTCRSSVARRATSPAGDLGGKGVDQRVQPFAAGDPGEDHEGVDRSPDVLLDRHRGVEVGRSPEPRGGCVGAVGAAGDLLELLDRRDVGRIVARAGGAFHLTDPERRVQLGEDVDAEFERRVQHRQLEFRNRAEQRWQPARLRRAVSVLVQRHAPADIGEPGAQDAHPGGEADRLEYRPTGAEQVLQRSAVPQVLVGPVQRNAVPVGEPDRGDAQVGERAADGGRVGRFHAVDQFLEAKDRGHGGQSQIRAHREAVDRGLHLGDEQPLSRRLGIDRLRWGTAVG
jgi:hypothetical protein